MPSSRATPSPSITLGCTLQPPLWPSHLGHFPRPLISHWPHIQTQTHQPDYIGAPPTIPSPCPTTARPTLIHPRLCAFSCALHPLHPCRAQLPTLVHPSIRHLCTKVWPRFLGQCLPALFFSDTTARQHKCLGPSHRRASQQRQHLAATLSPQPSLALQPAACSSRLTSVPMPHDSTPRAQPWKPARPSHASAIVNTAAASQQPHSSDATARPLLLFARAQ